MSKFGNADRVVILQFKELASRPIWTVGSLTSRSLVFEYDQPYVHK